MLFYYLRVVPMLKLSEMAMIVSEDKLSLDLQLQVYHNMTKFSCNSGTTALSRKKTASLSKITLSGMWGDNTNGLSLTALLRPTDSSSAIRRNYNYIIIDSKLSAYLVILDVELFNTLTSLLLMLFENYYQLILLHVFCFPTFHKKFLIEFRGHRI